MRVYAINICIIYIDNKSNSTSNNNIIKELYIKLSELNIDITQFTGISSRTNLSDAEYRSLYGYNRLYIPKEKENEKRKK